MKNLVLIRHAKSSWDNPALDDFDRPLNKRGQRDAPVMAGRLKELDITPDLFLSSPAERAVTTARTVAEGIDFPIEKIVQDEDIYLASGEDLLSIISQSDDSIERLFLVGHNPGLTELANHLGDRPIDNMPTCSIYSLVFEITSWKEILFRKGKTEFFDYPKKHG